MDFSCRIEASNMPLVLHASAQLCRIPEAAGDWKSSLTRSRTKPSVVALTSLDVFEINLNHWALPLPLAEALEGYEAGYFEEDGLGEAEVEDPLGVGDFKSR